MASLPAADRDAARYAIVSAPSPLGLWPSGVQLLAATLLEHGLAERLDARVAAELPPPPYGRARDPETGFLNGPKARAYALEIAETLAPLRAAGETPVLLGGDCSIQHGALVALRRRGRFGLLSLDGHADYYRGEASPTGEIADMGLAIATGAAHPLMADIDGLAPYVRPEDAVAFGFRDEAIARADGAPPVRGAGVRLADLPFIRREGFAAALGLVDRVFADPAIEGVWVHFDTDVLDDAINPAVDYRLPGGLSFEEAAAAVRAVRALGKLAGVSVSIFNPRLDPGGRVALGLVDCLGAALRG